MDLLRAYNHVNTILNKLDLGAVAKGFHKYGFALYNSEQICLNGKLIPYQESFIGNTAIAYENEFIAIWDTEIDPIEDMELLAYLLVHEMFHCYQKENNESRYPSDLELLCYPNDIDNFLKKYNENCLLADAYENEDVESFKRFHTLRSFRLNKYPRMVLQELLTETVEGVAEYAGLTALKKINAEKFKAVTEGYIKKLRTADELLFDIRKVSYYSGAMYLLCLDLFGVEEKISFSGEDGEKTVFEQNACRFGGADMPKTTPCDVISQNYNTLMQKKENIISEYVSKSTFVACDAYICGYDPMNMFRIGNIIYCSHFVCLNIKGKVEMIKRAVALEAKEGSIKEITGYYV